MESENLRTASSYINNLLLSRGLLRNGQTIDFSRPDKGEGGIEGTMGRVMSLVNDLILRRDRDAEQRESLSQTLRALRSENLRHTTEFERLHEKQREAQRKLSLAEAQERAMKNQLRSAEAAARALKEEMGRMRTLVNQTRAQCANEVRKRERVIEGLKKHVGEGGRARGSGKAVGVTTISVVPGIGEEGKSQAMSVNESGYDLHTETNGFLTELASGLSQENENLAGLVRRTVDTLRVLSGWQPEVIEGHEPQSQSIRLVMQTETDYDVLSGELDEVIEHLRTLLTNPSFVPLEEVEVREDEILRLRKGWEKMEGRWKEAVQMMDGWRKRMARSGQTVNLDELKAGLMLSPLKVKDVQEGAKNEQPEGLSMIHEEEESFEEGDTQADIEAMGSSFLDGPDRGDAAEDEREVAEEEQGEEEQGDYDEDEEDDEAMEQEDDESSAFEEDPADGFEIEELQDKEVEEDTFNYSSGIPPPPEMSPLRETYNTGNRKRSLTTDKDDTLERNPAFKTITEENTWDLAQLQSSPKTANRKSSRADEEVDMVKTSRSNPGSARSSQVSSKLQSSQRLQATPAKTASPSKSASVRVSSSSRLPRPASAQAMQSPLTMASIAAKLAATEREADAARVRAKLKAAKMNRSKAAKSTSAADVTLNVPEKQEFTGDPQKSLPPVAVREEAAREEKEAEDGGRRAEAKANRKRKPVERSQGGRAARRRSTLSPWELEAIIAGGVGSSER